MDDGHSPQLILLQKHPMTPASVLSYIAHDPCINRRIHLLSFVHSR